MLGAIIGDVAGSYIEVLEIQGRNTLDRHRSYDERVKILDMFSNFAVLVFSAWHFFLNSFFVIIVFSSNKLIKKL